MMLGTTNINAVNMMHSLIFYNIFRPSSDRIRVKQIETPTEAEIFPPQSCFNIHKSTVIPYKGITSKRKQRWLKLTWNYYWLLDGREFIIFFVVLKGVYGGCVRLTRTQWDDVTKKVLLSYFYCVKKNYTASTKKWKMYAKRKRRKTN